MKRTILLFFLITLLLTLSVCAAGPDAWQAEKPQAAERAETNMVRLADGCECRLHSSAAHPCGQTAGIAGSTVFAPARKMSAYSSRSRRASTRTLILSLAVIFVSLRAIIRLVKMRGQKPGDDAPSEPAPPTAPVDPAAPAAPAKRACPGCGAVLAGSETVCPYCGTKTE